MTVDATAPPASVNVTPVGAGMSSKLTVSPGVASAVSPAVALPAPVPRLHQVTAVTTIQRIAAGRPEEVVVAGNADQRVRVLSPVMTSRADVPVTFSNPAIVPV